MTRKEFISFLEENSIDCSIVSFDNTTKDGYIIRKNYYRWETLFRERGCEYNVIGFPSESDALSHLAEELLLLKTRVKDTFEHPQG